MKFLLPLVLFFSCLTAAAMPSRADISGWAEARFISDDNVFRDNTNLADTGFSADALVSVRSRIFGSTYPRFFYSYSALAYSQRVLMNRYTHEAGVSVSQRLSPIATAGVEGGAAVTRYPFFREYNAEAPYWGAFVKLYPSYTTECIAGWRNRVFTYPDYDLDAEGPEYYLTLAHDLPLDISALLSAGASTLDYRDRFVLDPVVLTGPVPTETRRSDHEQYVTARISRFFRRIGTVEASCRFARLDSNAGEFWWGPLQTASSNITGDEAVFPDFWDMETSRAGISIDSGSRTTLRAVLSASLTEQRFTGWPARTATEELRSPAQTRTDTVSRFSCRLEKYLWRRLCASTGFSYEANDSNDAPYNAVARTFRGGLDWYF
jgi:hypothetical protein